MKKWNLEILHIFVWKWYRFRRMENMIRKRKWRSFEQFSMEMESQHFCCTDIHIYPSITNVISLNTDKPFETIIDALHWIIINRTILWYSCSDAIFSSCMFLGMTLLWSLWIVNTPLRCCMRFSSVNTKVPSWAQYLKTLKLLSNFFVSVNCHYE